MNKRFWIHTALVIMISQTPQLAKSQTTGPLPPPAPWIVAGLTQLGALHFWTGISFSLNEDANRQAVIAFQKLEHLPRTGKLTADMLEHILHVREIPARDSLHKFHIEVDLNHQVLLIFDSLDQLKRILSISTGNGRYFETTDRGGRYALTPRGKFTVYSKVAGWKQSTLGLLFDPIYVKGGVAIHGARSVPASPASHGCIRIPMFAAQEMFINTPLGTPVVIYGENPRKRKG